MRNPNGYGTVAKLSGNRRKPYIVKKTVGFNEKQHPIYEIIGYATTREEGNILLGKFNDEPWDVNQVNITLQELYDLWKEKKGCKLGVSNQQSMSAAYNYCKAYAHMEYKRITAFHMQETIDNCGKSASVQNSIRALWGHIERFAVALDLSHKRYAETLTADQKPETSKLPFEADDIALVWQHVDEPWMDTVLILIYSGWRISELLSLKTCDVDLEKGTMKGGGKTEAGKNRIVPIHSRIRGFIEQRVKEGNEYLISQNGKCLAPRTYRDSVWSPIMDSLNLAFKPHECRHTFETILDNAGANRKCIDLMMGHKSRDTGNRVYNHKTLEDLKFNIELVTC